MILFPKRRTKDKTMLSSSTARCLLSVAAMAAVLAGCSTPSAPQMPIAASPARLDSESPAERRTALIRESNQGLNAIPLLTAALNDENLVVRRTAVRLLASHGEPAAESLSIAFTNNDPQVRRAALQALCLLKSGDALMPTLAAAIKDDDRSLRLLAIQQLGATLPVTGERLKLLQEAAKDTDPEISRIAQDATWPFFRETTLLKNRADWDHDVKTIQKIQLPKEDWAIMTDTDNSGHTKNWFAADFKDSDWKRIPIEDHWEKAGIQYDGYAWYRKTFAAPEKPAKYNAVELHFEAVDECAWVWLNGIYIGQHNLGPSGWTIPFSLDVTKEIAWGKDNQLTVRVLDSKGGGGIWKPVYLEVLE